MTTQSMQLESEVPELVELGDKTVATLMATFIDTTKPNLTDGTTAFQVNATIVCDELTAL